MDKDGRVPLEYVLENLPKGSEVIALNPDALNLVMLSKYEVSREMASTIARRLGQKCVVVMVGNPKEAVAAIELKGRD